VIVAVVIGLGVAAAAYWYGTRSTDTAAAKRTERPRVAASAPPASAAKKPVGAPAKPAKPATQAKPAKPRFDFYTILPEVETPLPPREPKKTVQAKPVQPEEGARYVLQAASYSDFEDADRLKARLALTGLEANIEKVTLEGKGDFYRVRLGPYEKLEALDDADRRLAEQGIKPLRLRLKKPAGT
jgi:cell division protein FtsN